MADELELLYFDIAGKAEPIRLAEGHEEEIRKLFRMYDAKKAGKISRRELTKALAATLDADEVDALFTKHQADDGMIHLDGFMRFMIETGSWDEDGPTPCLMHEHNELR